VSSSGRTDCCQLTGPMTPPKPHEKPRTAYAREALVSSVMSRMEPRNLDQHRPQIVTYDSDGSTEYSLDEPDADRLWQLKH
jgi:hypothetical protein